jgi:hypothetical protein
VPKPGDEWRINFSRVQWLHNWEGTTAPKDASKDASDTARPAYVKTPGKPEDNWVWTPQWQIDMHDPRWWGRVRFTK